MKEETSNLWVQLSEAISSVSIFIISAIASLFVFLFNRFEKLVTRVNTLEQRQIVDDEKFNQIVKSLERIESKFDTYDKNINDFWKNNPGLK